MVKEQDHVLNNKRQASRTDPKVNSTGLKSIIFTLPHDCQPKTIHRSSMLRLGGASFLACGSRQLPCGASI